MNKNKACTLLLCLLAALGILTACTGDQGSGQGGSIAGRVFFDENADQNCDECECGIAEASVMLYDESCGGEMIQMIKTDAEGYFQFSSLPAGSYCVYSGLTTSCEGLLPTTSLSQKVELAAGEAVDLDWFGYDDYIDSLRAED